LQSNSYTMGFVFTVTVICALLLSTVSTSLKDKQIANIELDMKRNILAAVGLIKSEKPLENKEILHRYDKYIEKIFVDQYGNKIEFNDPKYSYEKELKPFDFTYRLPKGKLNIPEGTKLKLPLFIRKDDNGEHVAYAIPIIGKGLWSTLYGYLALQSDLVTVMGITFYKHGETPGLGGEIEMPWFQQNFKGKKILNEKGNLESVKVLKGKVLDKFSKDQPAFAHHVDGIAGATLTSNGVTALLMKDLTLYRATFQSLKNRGGEWLKRIRNHSCLPKTKKCLPIPFP